MILYEAPAPCLKGSSAGLSPLGTVREQALCVQRCALEKPPVSLRTGLAEQRVIHPFHGISVYPGCCNSVPWTGYHIDDRNGFSQILEAGSRADSVRGGPASRIAGGGLSSGSACGRRCEEALCSLLSECSSHSWRFQVYGRFSHLTKGPPPNTIALGTRFQHMHLAGTQTPRP